MLVRELVVEAQTLRGQGWTVSAIARHLGVTRLTVRRYLSGEQTPGFVPVRRRTGSPSMSNVVGGGWAARGICGPPRCSTRSPRWATWVRIRRSPARSVNRRKRVRGEIATTVGALARGGITAVPALLSCTAVASSRVVYEPDLISGTGVS